MLRGRRAAIAGAFAIVALTAVAAGCGGGSNSKSGALSLDPVAAAATKTQTAGAARIRFAMALTGPQTRGKTLQLRGVGAIDGTSSEMSFKLGSMVGKMGIPSPAMTKLAHASMKAIALVENGDYVMYMRLGFLSSELPGGKQWIKLDLSKFGQKEAGVNLGSLLSGSQFEPSDLLGMLKAEGAKVHKVGEATINGAATTHYRVTIDLAKALRSKGVASPVLAGIAAHMKSVSDDVWVGKDGLVRRIRAAYSLPALSSATHMAMTMDLYDYGAHVTIAAPPSSEVFDATQLAQSGIASSLP
jgi:hypothetical protein